MTTTELQEHAADIMTMGQARGVAAIRALIAECEEAAYVSGFTEGFDIAKKTAKAAIEAV